MTPRRSRRSGSAAPSSRSRGPRAPRRSSAPPRTPSSTRSCRPATSSSTTTWAGWTGWCRSTHPLIERIALIWHDWFGVSDEFVHHFALVDAHIDLFRRQGLGSFRDLLIAVASDPAMLVRLDGKDNHAGATNENFARELMELFTLGADRGAYTEPDIREAARALTGWTADYVGGIGWTDFAYDPARHDTGVKRIFGQDGTFDWRATCDLCLAHPLHPSFFVLKLWSYFIPTPPDAATQAELERRYVASGMSILVGARGDPHAPRVLHGLPAGQAAGRLRRRADARGRARNRVDRLGGLRRGHRPVPLLPADDRGLEGRRVARHRRR